MKTLALAIVALAIYAATVAITADSLKAGTIRLIQQHHEASK